MDVTFKYEMETAPETKDLKDFMTDVYETQLDKFLKSEIMFLIGPDLGDRNTIFYLDIDFKNQETSEPNLDVSDVYTKLNKAFHPFKFNLELTPGGCHIVSEFIYKRLNDSMVETKKQLSTFIDNIRNLDIDASFSLTPLRRLGYDKSRNFFYAPAGASNNALRNNFFGKQNPYSDVYWREYIRRSLVPTQFSMPYMKLIECLTKFSDDRS